ncbi:MAG TPA: MBL fold metallo-hydrolase [Gemmatimonadales bacterium]|nr:MBL fold metallo-hydrolase [Gemmatimonadales bacterium]
MLAVASPLAQGLVAPRRDGIAITFLANEGVLLSANEAGGVRKVLIDALFERYDGYAIAADSTQSALRQGRAPFDSVDVVLITHRHGDHFHPVPVSGHLGANPRALVVSSQQVVDSLRRHLAPALRSSQRLAARTTPPGTRRRLLVNGIPVELLGLPHSGGRRHRQVEHLAYVIDLGGRRILHVGDAELSEATLATFRLDTMRIDVALIPYWAVDDDDTRRVIERWIRPRRIAAFHFAENDSVTARAVQQAAPGAHIFAHSLDRVGW